MELSIVLVILGLLVGGVLAGRSLIRSAELNAVVHEQNQYKAMLNAFQVKYNALPGDISDATHYWGAKAASSCTSQPADGIRTCDGNGNGQIHGLEAVYLWQHLSNAGLVQGQFAPGASLMIFNGYGILSNPGPPDTMYPRSKLGENYWMVINHEHPNISTQITRFFNTSDIYRRNLVVISGMRD